MEDLGLPASQSPSGEADNQPQSSFRPVLQDPARQIRLFKIEDTKDDPENERQAIRLSMDTFDLAHAPEYTAISYTWGDRILREKIVVNGEDVRVTTNCHFVLTQLRDCKNRHEGVYRPYRWLDSICIDQDSDAEKSIQVGLMGDIFHGAHCVLISLGPSSELERWDDQPLDELDAPADPLEKLDGVPPELLQETMRIFSEQNYWERLWIVQEVVMAQNGYIVDRGRMFSLSVIKAMAGRVVLPSDSRLSQDSPARAFRRLLRYEGDKGLKGSEKLNEVYVPQWTLENLLRDFADFKCVDLRDRVFGMLSMYEKPDVGSQLRADYSMSILGLAVHLQGFCREWLTTESDRTYGASISPFGMAHASTRALKLREWRPTLGASYFFRDVTGGTPLSTQDVLDLRNEPTGGDIVAELLGEFSGMGVVLRLQEGHSSMADATHDALNNGKVYEKPLEEYQRSRARHCLTLCEADAWFIVYSLGVYAGAFDPNIAERGRLEAVTDLSAVARQTGAAGASFGAAGDTSCVEQSSASVGVRLVTVLPANTFQALLTRSSHVSSRPWAESQAEFAP